MKIDSSALSMDASSNHTDVKRTGRGMVILDHLPQNQTEKFTLNFGRADFIRESVHTSEQVTSLEVQSKVSQASNPPEEGTHTLLAGMVEGLLEKEVDVTIDPGRISSEEIEEDSQESKELKEAEAGEMGGFSLGGNPFEVAFSAHSLHYEHQSVNVLSEGAIHTADGRNISFSLDLQMERTSFSYQNFSFASSGGLFIDPLVLNFDTALETLTDTSFIFDIDGDGEDDNLTGLGSGTGFLALDINGDQKINDGHELFGPMTGHGFQELEIHDVDQNKWIDENDPIFHELRVWMQAGSEEEELLTLQEAGVGAISLANVDSLFDLKDKENNLLGQVTRSGIFLMEDGQVRSLQEIDYALPGPTGEFARVEGPVTDIPQAINSLRFLLSRHRERVQSMLAKRMVDLSTPRDNVELQDKFWAWQEGVGKIG